MNLTRPKCLNTESGNIKKDPTIEASFHSHKSQKNYSQLRNSTKPGKLQEKIKKCTNDLN